MSRNKEIHTRMNNAIFPISAEYFCEIQESLTGNTTTAGMRRVFEAIVPVINEVFEKGKRGEVWKSATPKEIGKAVKKHIAAGKRGFHDKAGERDGGMAQACI